MNVAKNWALTTMQTTLAFAHFSSKLLLKEQMIIPVKKTLNNAGHINAKLIVFSEICQKKTSEIGCFLLIVSWRSFLWICPWKSFEIWLFPLKCREIGRFSCEFWLFSRNRRIFHSFSFVCFDEKAKGLTYTTKNTTLFKLKKMAWVCCWFLPLVSLQATSPFGGYSEK